MSSYLCRSSGGMDLPATSGNSDMIFKGCKFNDSEGNSITGTMMNRGDSTNAGGDVGLYLNSSYPGIAVSLTDAAYFTVNSDGVNRFCMQAIKGAYGLGINQGYLGLDASTFGNASASDVRPGVTFTSQNGLKLTGTMDINANIKTTTLNLILDNGSPYTLYAPGTIVGIKNMWSFSGNTGWIGQFSVSGNSLTIWWSENGVLRWSFIVAYI